MIDRVLIKKIIEASINAPSGSNSQPWEFICTQNPFSINIKYLPEKDHPILNFRNRGTLIACGALIENFSIACQYYGLEPKITILEKFPEKIIAKIELNETNKKDDELYSSLKTRCSNRKPYKKIKLEETIKNYLLAKIKDYPQIDINCIEDKNLIKDAARNLAYDTYLNFKNSYLHAQLKKELLFDDKLAQQGSEGLYIKTMEFNRPQVFLVKKLLNRNFLEIMGKLGIVNVIYKNVSRLYASTECLIGLSVVNDDKEFINVGRLIENIWLRATKLNLHCHIITGIPFLWQKTNFDNINIFNDLEKHIINNAYDVLKKIFNVSSDKIFIGVLRIGYASSPSAISLKKDPNIIFK